MVFAAYGVPGVSRDAVEAHLTEIERLVRIVSLDSDTIFRRVVQAEG